MPFENCMPQTKNGHKILFGLTICANLIYLLWSFGELQTNALISDACVIAIDQPPAIIIINKFDQFKMLINDFSQNSTIEKSPIKWWIFYRQSCFMFFCYSESWLKHDEKIPHVWSESTAILSYTFLHPRHTIIMYERRCIMSCFILIRITVAVLA